MNRGDYGVCGPAAAAVALIQPKPILFARLLEASFSGVPFNGTAILEKQQTGKSVLLHQRQQMLRQKSTVIGTEHDDSFDRDFIVARSLGKLLKVHC